MWWDELISFIDWIKNAAINGIGIVINGLSNVYSFLATLISLGISIVSLINSIFYTIFLTNPYATTTFSLIMLGFSVRIAIRLWNIMADIEIMGFRLPKL